MFTVYRLAVSVFVAAGVFSTSVSAQQYPTQPIRMVLPSPPGGGTDLLARIFQDGLVKTLGQPVLIDHRGGASGRISAALVAKSAPNGYTLFFTYGGVLTTGAPLFGQLPYDPVKDFSAVAMVAHVPGVLVAHPSFAPNNVAELIKLAKSKELAYGSSSNGSSSHLNMELLKQMAGINMDKVAHNGDAPALNALLGGHVLFAFSNVVAAAPHMKANKLKALGVATPQRVPAIPDVPTIAESGLPGFEGILFYAIVGPAGIPNAITARLNNAVTQIKKDPKVSAELSRLGAIPMDMTPDELGQFIKSEIEKWTKVIKTGNIDID